MKRCVTNCRECKVSNPPHPSNTFNVDRPEIRYEWCVFRHEEPLKRGEYNEVRPNGNISGTMCYRSKIVPRTVLLSRVKRGTM